MISSTSNAQVKQVVALQTKAKVRREQGQFVVEGLRLTVEVPADRLERLYVTQQFLQEHPEAVRRSDRETAVLPYEIVTEQVLRAMSDTQNPQGILGVVRQQEYSIEEMCRGKKAPLLLILENIQDPGNLGTMMRTAEAAGVDGVIMSRDTVDIYNPKVVRSTMGAIFRLPFAYVESLDEVMEQCRQLGITTYAAHLGGKNNYDKENYGGGSAFLIGNEGNGLTDKLAGQADILVKIPMAGKAESLNAAVAAAVLVYEAARQREFA
ncbi:MAG: 23S rRNA (guanosine(2251)-2'-O)-methyltransferase RlmB [Lachnospiraceae bacterium]|nr:23S rRNA (guanosine(2251)-2'-O)-methyltransferase RlmB [Lachnospiraceae bacterium]